MEVVVINDVSIARGGATALALLGSNCSGGEAFPLLS